MFYIFHVDEMTISDGDAVPPFIVQSIPFFFLFILIEMIYMNVFLDKKQRVDTNNKSPPPPHTTTTTNPTKSTSSNPTTPIRSYRMNDFLCSLSLGTVQQLVDVIFGFLNMKVSLFFYQIVYNNYRLFTIDITQYKYISFVILFLGTDLAYYWFHRTVHVYHILWALGHNVHHSGEDYNFACALRQGIGQGFTSWPFYLPLALLGFPPPSFAAHSQANTIYQFWVHTEMIGRLGILENIFSTPSAHRVHHTPPGNANYGGVLIIWDKLFGTYKPEVVRMDYFGLASQPQTFNPIALNLQHFFKMNRRMIFGKRATHPFVFEPMSIFKSMPPMQSGNNYDKKDEELKEDGVLSSWTVPLNQKRQKFDPIKDYDINGTSSKKATGLNASIFIALSIGYSYVILLLSSNNNNNSSVIANKYHGIALCIVGILLLEFFGNAQTSNGKLPRWIDDFFGRKGDGGERRMTAVEKLKSGKEGRGERGGE